MQTGCYSVSGFICILQRECLFNWDIYQELNEQFCLGEGEWGAQDIILKLFSGKMHKTEKKSICSIQRSSTLYYIKNYQIKGRSKCMHNQWLYYEEFGVLSR